MIRQAHLTDIPQIIELALESVSKNPIPVKTDKAAMMDMAARMVGNPAHFVWVALDGTTVTACVAAFVQPAFWFRGLQASIVLFYAKTPGAGAVLMRKFAHWVKGRTGIKCAVFELEPEADQRLIDFTARLGFARKSANMTYIRGIT
jgi:hypothetical protein